MIGIYVITNKTNGKQYVGQTNNIARRRQEHARAREGSRIGVHKAIQKYGWDNFTFEVLEECSIKELDSREEYWIQKLNTLSPNGYNLNPGGGQESIGESNGRAVLTEQDVVKIREAYKNKKRRREVYAEFSDKISFSTFASIWDGTQWPHVMPEVFTPELKRYYSKEACLGEKSHSAVFTDEEVLKMRQRYVNETAKEIYKDVEDRCAYQTLQQILWGRAWKHLPIYKKKEKRWVHP